MWTLAAALLALLMTAVIATIRLRRKTFIISIADTKRRNDEVSSREEEEEEEASEGISAASGTQEESEGENEEGEEEIARCSESEEEEEEEEENCWDIGELESEDDFFGEETLTNEKEEAEGEEKGSSPRMEHLLQQVKKIGDEMSAEEDWPPPDGLPQRLEVLRSLTIATPPTADGVRKRLHH